MKTNTKQFYNFIDVLLSYNLNPADKTKLFYNSILNGLKSNNFSLNDKINFIYTNKSLTPKELQNIYNNNNLNNLYFITINNFDDVSICCGYAFNGKKIIENNPIFDFCKNYYYNFKDVFGSNAEMRKTAVLTVLIYQDKKYIDAVKEKQETRRKLKQELFYNDRFIFKKSSFVETCNEPENQQRYKYIHKEYIKEVLTFNQVLKNKYRFSLSNSGWFYTGDSNIIEMDQSGYILTYKRDDLKRRATALKMNNQKNKFMKEKSKYYILTLTNAKEELKKVLLAIYKKMVDSGNIKNIFEFNYNYNCDFKTLYNDLEWYLSKLKNETVNDSEFFEKNLKDLINNKYNNFILKLKEI